MRVKIGAERVGFEPTRGYYSPSTLAVCRFQPGSATSPFYYIPILNYFLNLFKCL